MAVLKKLKELDKPLLRHLLADNLAKWPILADRMQVVDGLEHLDLQVVEVPDTGAWWIPLERCFALASNGKRAGTPSTIMLPNEQLAEGIAVPNPVLTYTSKANWKTRLKSLRNDAEITKLLGDKKELNFIVDGPKINDSVISMKDTIKVLTETAALKEQGCFVCESEKLAAFAAFEQTIATGTDAEMDQALDLYAAICHKTP